jgi:putative flippase GtrA
VRTWLTARYDALPPALVEFLKFGTVGAIGFVFDTGTVYALYGGLGLIGAGIAAYVVAATCTWLLNRLWTFRGRGGQSAGRQWALFLAANAVGFTLNRGTFALAVTYLAVAARYPVLAVAAGTAAGMGVNFFLSRRIVFR